MGPTGAGGAGCGNVSTSLVGWWKFDDGSGTVANDSSGNGNTGTLTGSTDLPTWTTSGKINGALTFDGTDDYVSTTYSVTSYPITACAWVNYNSNSSVNSFIIGTGGGTPFRFYVYNDIGNQDYVELYNNISSVVSASDSIRAGVWNHVCAVADASNNGSLYINGVLSAGPTNIGAPNFSGATVNIGRDLSSGNYFNGTIDDVRVYTRALSAAEISALASLPGAEGDLMYNNDYHLYQFCDGTNWVAMGPTGAGSATSYAPSGGLVGWWKLDEASGTVAADSSGNSNTGTASGTTIVAGKIGNARSFNGTSDYVAVGNPASLQIAGDITMCAWVYPTNGGGSFIMSKGDGSGSIYDYGLYIAGAGSLTFYYGAGLGIGSTAFTTPNVWQHACVVVYSNVATFYLNGVSYAGGAVSVTNHNQSLDIGAAGGSSPVSAWDFPGTIDDARVYNRALSATEITALYNYTGGSNCSPEGGMFYDSDHAVMQYCNGAGWVKIGQ
jgi:hypothetical protein